jgi:multiple antibiotic resistance protein
MHESFFRLWGLFLGTIIGVLPIINPFAGAVTFIAITEGDTRARRLGQARMACVYVTLILAGALLCGSFVMNFFGISIPGLRIAGGIIVAGVGMKMLAPKHSSPRRDDTDHQAALAKNDVSFSPMAMPILSGPGSIAVTIGFASLATTWVDYGVIILGIVVSALACYLVLRVTLRMNGLLGPNGLSALTQMMGFIIMCMGVQFIVNGVLALLSEPDFAAAMHAAFGAGASGAGAQ